MGIAPAILRALADAGASTEMIIAALEADQKQADERLAEKRAKDAARKRAQRERDKASAMSRGQDVIPPDNMESAGQKENSPHTPLKENPSSTLRSDEGAASAPMDPRTVLFQSGLKELSDLSGRPQSKLRSIVGKWLRDCDDDPLRVLALISKAKQDRPAGPVEWIERHLQARGPPRNGASRPLSTAEQALHALDQYRDPSDRQFHDPDSRTGGTIEASYARRIG